MQYSQELLSAVEDERRIRSALNVRQVREDPEFGHVRSLVNAQWWHLLKFFFLSFFSS